MDFNLIKIGGFIVLIIVYLTVRKLIRKFADFTENIGHTTNYEEELNLLKSKIIVLEEQIKHKP